MAVLKLPVVLLTSATDPRLVLLCAAASPARERPNERSNKDGEKRSSVGMAKHMKSLPQQLFEDILNENPVVNLSQM
jgi:hypothetical protein